jgi:hypothetical protein
VIRELDTLASYRTVGVGVVFASFQHIQDAARLKDLLTPRSLYHKHFNTPKFRGTVVRRHTGAVLWLCSSECFCYLFLMRTSCHSRHSPFSYYVLPETKSATGSRPERHCLAQRRDPVGCTASQDRADDLGIVPVYGGVVFSVTGAVLCPT